MVPLEKAVIIKLKKEGKNYELLVDCERALAYRKGKVLALSEVVVSEEIFHDAKKGNRVSENDLKKAFGTDDTSEVCVIILKEGHLPLSTDLLRNEIDAKKKQLVELIHRNTINPQTGKPHSSSLIASAMQEARIVLDVHKSIEQQMKDVVDSLRKILPLKFETRILLLTVPLEYSSHVFSVVKKYGTLLNEQKTDLGKLLFRVELPSGLAEEFEIALNNLSKGTIELKIE